MLIDVLQIALPAFTAVCAIVAPIITSIISNKHQKKMKQIEILYSVKIKAAQDFLYNFGRYRSDGKYSDYQNTYAFIYNVLELVPKEAEPHFLKLADLIHNNPHSPEVEYEFDICLSYLPKEESDKRKS